MKKLGMILAAAAAAITLGSGTVAAYPPGAIIVSDSTLAPGQSFTVTFTLCDLGETVEFELAGTTTTAPCTGPAGAYRVAQAGGSATATLVAPTTPGTYTITATGLTSGNTGTFTITVEAVTTTTAGATTTTVAGGLPPTGSDSAPIAQIGGGLVAAGAGLALVAGIRRRKAHA